MDIPVLDLKRSDDTAEEMRGSAEVEAQSAVQKTRAIFDHCLIEVMISRSASRGTINIDLDLILVV